MMLGHTLRFTAVNEPQVYPAVVGRSPEELPEDFPKVEESKVSL